MFEKLRERLPAYAATYLPWITLAALLAVGAFYVMGFAQAAWAHDAFHDLRHALGTPCH